MLRARNAMKSRIWFLHTLFVCVFSAAFVIHELGSAGLIRSGFQHQQVLPRLRRLATVFADLKFKLRGPRPPKSAITIVEIDSPSIEELGRWPWRRDYTAFLVERVFQLGARFVALDIVFSEPEQRVPEELAEALRARGLGVLADSVETDPKLAAVFDKYKGRIALAWTTESPCQPLYHTREACPVAHPEALAMLPRSLERFSLREVRSRVAFDPELTPLMSAPTLIANAPLFNAVTRYQGFANAFRDPDGIIRRTSLLMMINGRVYPSFPLAIARMVRGEELIVSLDESHRIEELRWSKTGQRIPVTASGVVEVAFRGPERTFSYVSAMDVMREDETGRDLASATALARIQGATVLIGVSALALSDIASTPFDHVIPGVEVQANIVDNLLANDFLSSSAALPSSWAAMAVILLLMLGGGTALARLAERQEALFAIAGFFVCLAILFIGDATVLFPSGYSWNTSFLYMEILCLAVFTIGQKYIAEERNKKFLRLAFSKYVSPAVVDSIVRDPSRLNVGGVRKELTILFSDIRGFTTFSEKMEAKLLSEFLNDYFGQMTEILFRYGGTLDKYIGDAVMAFFNAPVDLPDHARCACEAGRAMLRSVQANHERWKVRYGVDVQIGVGINTGPVSVGNMGSERSFGYTVIGDAVNLASRLEGVTKTYGVEILTSQFTLGQMTERSDTPPPFRVLDLVKVKGKKDAVQIIQIFPDEPDAAGLALFEDAREAYRSREWDEAIRLFGLAATALGNDAAARMYAERCAGLKTAPPPADWDGSWVLESK